MPSATRGVMFIGTLNNIDTTTCEQFIEAWTKTGGAAFATGQLEKGEEGTIHLQYFIHLKEKATLSKLKSHCKHSHFELVKKDNGAAEYCNKEETRIEGPWTSGVRPARLDKKGDRARQNMELVTMGPAKALEEGLIGLKDYTRVK